MRSFVLLLLASACATAEGDPRPAGPVVLELFTSQGCSSCPPADRILDKLARTGALGGKQVVPLSFHVDYWNDLGWRDPYSLPAWTERQYEYSRALGDQRVYTPELVVGGASGMVGSNMTAIALAVGRAERPALLPVTAVWSPRKLAVTATAPANADVLVAVFETARTNKVPRGENSGETLAHRNVVRRLERVASAGQAGTLEVAIDPAWSQVGAVVFAQRRDKKIVASALVPRP
jgi:hypothetical protein